MRRNVRQQQYNWENAKSDAMDDIYAAPAIDDAFMEMVQFAHGSGNGHTKMPRSENTLEVKVQEGDTLQALALRFHCSVADIKRLNKIDRDNEIHAHRIIRIPVTVHNVLLGASNADALPAVHRSGNNSPRHNLDQEPAIERNPLEDARMMLDERLLVAAVNASGTVAGEVPASVRRDGSKFYDARSGYPDDEANVDKPLDDSTALLDDMLVDRHAPIVRPIPGPSLRAIDWSGSDCDMSWICLLIFILALCFVIPLVYVIYLAEHPHHNHTS
ncbi:PREDICTED: lysM and putative peptidoglycan-binding domain-containing protein 4 isoform X1 [Drosophila arizonae]|uniref:LysM and putative peptidoglycan-binding domain-containing protein 4 isoform X1 n=1 Tax=Drosophila arizonae TaxID=7263 RepID=A0ABM1PHP8_DROAR|nr:PREDICTED: lysM and putative peptidoglycan-binding domain-containing protein 4 isoform X1 [Drosophila arizonae]